MPSSRALSIKTKLAMLAILSGLGVFGFVMALFASLRPQMASSTWLNYLLLALAVAGVFAVTVTILAQRLVAAPLAILADLSQRVVATADYSLRTGISRGDEIGQVAAAMDAMLAQIQARDARLEKQVNRRTEELKRLVDEFRYQALHDHLTGLPNRALLTEQFRRATAHADRVSKHFALLLLDLDDFKGINDTYGHHAGDEVLRAVARRIRAAVRAEDHICRLGGDEFVILIEEIAGVEQVQKVAGALQKSLNEPLWLGDIRLNLGVSVGASLYPVHGITLEALKQNADTAMYMAKRAGKRRCEIFVPTATSLA